MRKMCIKKLRIQLIVLNVIALLILSACGGGGGGDTSLPTDTNETDTTETDTTATDTISGFDFSLQEGDFWEYVWDYSQSTTSSSGTSSESDIGVFRITLGAPVQIDNVSAFPLIVSGKVVDPGSFTYVSNWTHIAVSGNQILASADGTSLEVIFDANTGTWTGGGFFDPVDPSREVSAYEDTVDNQFVNTSAYRIGSSSSQSLCETIAGFTVCSNDESFTITEDEYFKEGIGPLAYEFYSSSTYTGGGYTTYHHTERILGLIDSSLTAPDGFSAADYPWRPKSEIPTTLTDYAWGSSAAEYDGKIYILNAGTLHIYDPVDDIWSQGTALSTGYTGQGAVVYNDLIYFFNAGENQDIYSYDPSADSWSYIENFAFDGYTAQQRVTTLSDGSGGVYYGVFLNDEADIYFYDFLVGDHVSWSDSYPGYPVESGIAVAQVNDIIYSFGGGYYNWGSWSYYVDSYKIDPYADSPAWVQLASMPTSRRGAFALPVGDDIYVIGGEGSSDDASNAVEMYNTLTDQWTVKSSSLLDITYGLAFFINDKIYIIDSGYVLEYDPSKDL